MRRNSCHTNRKWLLGAATGLTVLLPAAGFAQSAAPADQAATPEAKPAGLGEIVVTATRRSESVQKVPISLQALTPEKLEQRQVVNFSDYAALLPSVSYASLGPGRSDLYFRGISFDSEGAGDTSQLSVAGIYLDEIPMTTAGRMPEVHVYDMQRVEALSGPQGTLFGSSSLSGTLRLITNKPKIGVFEGGYDVELNKFTKAGNNFGTVDEGFVNIPVNKNIAVRLMAYYDHTGGYIDNVPGSLTYGIYAPSPGSSVVVNGTTYANYAQVGSRTLSNSSTIPADFNTNIAKRNSNPVDEYGGRLAVLGQFGDWSVLPELVYQYLDAKGSFNFDPKVGDLQVHDYGPTENRDAWLQAALTINGKIGDFDLVSSTGYFHRRIKNVNDYTYYTVSYDVPGDTGAIWFHDTNGNYINPTQEYYGNNTFNKFTQEVRLSTPKSWPFTATIGAFYQWQKKEINEDYAIAGLSQSPDGAQFALRRDAYYLTEVDKTNQDYALFGEATYEIVSKLKLTGGIRLFRAKSKAQGWEGVGGGPGCTVPFTGPRLLACDNVSQYYDNGVLKKVPPYDQSGETHKISLSYQIEPKKMVYATYSTGFRPGGPNTIAPNNPYKADTLANFEAGFKTGWGPNFRLNGAVYYEKWNGLQYFIVPVGYNGNGLSFNAANARVLGVESDFDWKIGPLSLSGSGSYNDAKLTTDFCSLTAPDAVTLWPSCAGDPTKTAAPKGTRLPRQPKFKGQMQARYSYTVGPLDSFAQFALEHQSSSTSNLDLDKDAKLGDTPGFTTVDFSTGVSKDKWSVELFVENIFDTRGQLSRNTFCAIEVCANSTRTLPSRPRFIGVKFSNKF